MRDAVQPVYRRRESATPAGARRLREGLARVLEGLEAPAAERDALLLAVAELAVNPGRHADPPAREVEVELARAGSAWKLAVSDDGAPFTAFEAAWTATPGDFLAEDGRGLTLLAAHFDAASYRACEPEAGRALNTVELTLEGTGPPRPRVLVVDDDAPTLRVLTLYLASRYDVLAAGDAEAALALIDTGPVDLVVSDLRMPGADGIALHGWLVERGLDTLPFIFLSAEPESRAGTEGLAIDGYLDKPVDRERLMRTVDRVLRRARQVRSRLGSRLDAGISGLLAPELPPDLGAWRGALRSRPAGVGGGDFLFARERLDGSRLLLLGDVMGHGETAKFYSHALVGYLHGLLRGLPVGAGPGLLLDEASRALAEDRLLGRTLVTLLALSLHPDGSVRLASAGHPSPLRETSTGLEPVPVAGTLPGLGVDATYEEVLLPPGFGRLWCFTDGLLEQGGAQHEPHRAAMLEALSRTSGLELETALDAVWGRYLVAVADGADDDAMLLVLEPTPQIP